MQQFARVFVVVVPEKPKPALASYLKPRTVAQGCDVNLILLET